jgi:cytochrome c biogenesis DsbD-like protein
MIFQPTGYAGSLSGSTQLFLVGSVLTVALLTGCSRNSGITAVPGGLPSSSATPMEVSNSAQVVKVTGAPTEIVRGSSADAVVKLSISPGYHVNANPATYPYLIATEITPDRVEGVSASKPKYPAAKTRKFQFAEEPLAVYEGDIEIKLPLKAGVEKVAAGQRSLTITVRVQACDTEKCFPPATLTSNIPVEVK